VLTTWGVLLDLDLFAEEDPAATARRAFAAGRDAYLAHCPILAEVVRREAATLRVTAERLDPIATTPGSDGLQVAVSVVEIRPSSFEMAVRIRVAANDVGPAVNGRCTIALERRATGERIPIPNEVRDEFIAIQLAARDYA
jgi:acyl-CoA thioesterase FadM